MKLLNKLVVNLKNFFNINSDGCNVLDCYQGRNCSCQPIRFSEAIMEVHNLASKVQDSEIKHELRMIGDRLAQLGNEYHEKYSK